MTDPPPHPNQLRLIIPLPIAYGDTSTPWAGRAVLPPLTIPPPGGTVFSCLTACVLAAGSWARLCLQAFSRRHATGLPALHGACLCQGGDAPGPQAFGTFAELGIGNAALTADAADRVTCLFDNGLDRTPQRRYRPCPVSIAGLSYRAPVLGFWRGGGPCWWRVRGERRSSRSD